jgi:hypothetical protein
MMVLLKSFEITSSENVISIFINRFSALILNIPDDIALNCYPTFLK